MKFTWTKFFKAFADRLSALDYANHPEKRKEELIPKLKTACAGTDISFPFDKIPDIDPFSIYSLFNGGVKDNEKRQMIIRKLNKSFPDPNNHNDSSTANVIDEKELPADFSGVQLIEIGGGGLGPNFAPYSRYKKDDMPSDDEDINNKISKLWSLFTNAIQYARSPDIISSAESFKKSYDDVQSIFPGQWRISSGLLWIAPEFFVPLDKHSRGYIDFLGSFGVFEKDFNDKVTAALGKGLPNADDYLTIREGLARSFERPNAFCSSFCEFSDNAYSFQRTAEMKSLLEANGQIILHGAPGTGKTHTAMEVACAVTRVSFHKKDHPQIKYVQFHPSYDYSDFIVGLKPVLVGENGMKQVSFEWKSGILKQIAEAARRALDAYANAYATGEGADKDQKGYLKDGQPEFDPPKFVLLIDEINRADLSNVFGEVFSCMEYRYRYKRQGKEPGKLEIKDGNPTLAIDENAVEITLPSIKTDDHGNEVRDKDGQLVHETLVIPENLYIIGTMNDIDRSVEGLDFALRRRFAWKEIDAKDSKRILEAEARKGIFNEIVKNRLGKAMDALNFEIRGEAEGNKKPELELRLGKPYELGGAYFAKLKLYAEEDGKYGDAAFNSLWENHLAVILREYLRGGDNPEKLDELKKKYDTAVSISAAESKKQRRGKEKGEPTPDAEESTLPDRDGKPGAS